MASFHPLTDEQQSILNMLLEKPFPGRNQLVEQLRGLQAQELDTKGSLRFLVQEGHQALVHKRVVVDARYADLDTGGDSGPHVNILLHVVDGKLFMLEFYKDDGSSILKFPLPRDIKIY